MSERRASRRGDALADDLLRLHGDVLARGADDDFAVNVVPGGPPPWLREAILAAFDDIATYPREDAAAAAVAERHGRDPAEVVLVNGAAQAFWLIARALEFRSAVCVHPSFTEPEAALRAAGHQPRRLMLEAPWSIEGARVPDDADLVVVGNPTNPTGVLHRSAQLRSLCRPGRVTVVDEAFMDFVPGEPESLTGDRVAPGLVVMRSLTKLYGIPGLRAGYLLAEPRLAGRLRDARPAWSVNALALAATVACLRRPDHARAVAVEVGRARADLTARLASVTGIVAHPAAANFVLVEASDGRTRTTRLRERGIAVRPCHSFPGLTHDHLRIAVREPAAHARLTGALVAAGDAPATPA